MIRVEHVSIQLKSAWIAKDISFSLANQGFVSFCAESQAASEMARYLMALDCPNHGEIIFDDIKLTKQRQIQSQLRSTCVQGMAGDFQLLSNRSVHYNTTLGLPYPEHRVQSLLKEWGLVHLQDVQIEDLEFIDQARAVIVRCLLREPNVLVYDAASSPFSEKEKMQLYPLLQRCSERMLVIVCGDDHASPFADHILETYQGALISDTLCERIYPRKMILQPYHLPKEKQCEIRRSLHHQTKWKFLILFLCLLISMMSINIVLFSAQLNLIELEESVLTKAGQSAIEIEKQAVGNDGFLYKNRYEYFNGKDVSTLQQQFGKHLVFAYQVENPSWQRYELTKGLYDPKLLTEYGVIELDHEQDLALSHVIGHFPKRDSEVCISDLTALDLIQAGYFDSLEEDAQAADVIGETINWFGAYLQITGIIPNAQNPNLAIEVKELQNNITQTKRLYKNQLFVKKGFIQNHDVSNSLIYPDLNTMITMNGQDIDIGQIQSSAWSDYYYDGETMMVDNGLQEDECYVDFYLAYDLLYRDRNINKYSNAELNLTDFYQQANKLIGQTLYVQSYRIQGAAENSMVFQKAVRIKGMIPAMYAVTAQDYITSVDNSVLYLNNETIAPYKKPNYRVTGIFYQNKDPIQMRQTLNTLNQHPYYHAFVSNSRMFQVFVVDIKELKNVLLFIGCMFMLCYIAGTLYLLERSRIDHYKEMSILYLFGNHRSSLELLYVKHALLNLAKYTMLATLAAFASIYILIYYIYYDFGNHASIPILSYYMIPIYFMLFFYCTTSLAIYLFIRMRCILDGYFQSHHHLLK